MPRKVRCCLSFSLSVAKTPLGEPQNMPFEGVLRAASDSLEEAASVGQDRLQETEACVRIL